MRHIEHTLPATELPSLAELGELRAALVVAHPGHECRVLGWVNQLRPHVSILTDGSGRANAPRIGRTAQLLRQAGAEASELFGTVSDRFVYQSLIDQNVFVFRDLVHTLADSLIRHRVELVLGDSAEGEIMVHDLFREVRIAAVRCAESALGYPIHHCEFPLEAHPLAFPPSVASQVRRLTLDAPDFRSKVAIARTYEEIAPFVDAALETHGEKAFSVEGIFPVTAQSLLPEHGDEPLPYERHGQRQCELGHYHQAITWEDHIQPIAEQLAQIPPRPQTAGASPVVGSTVAT